MTDSFPGWRSTLAALTLGLAASHAPAQSADYIVAIVNQELVTAAELQQRVARVRDEANRAHTPLPPPAALRQQVLDTLIDERVLITTLTKRMAEQLTDYLSDNGVKVRYLHSDIETVERVEILRDLRLGTFDVLVGINLLREGLDIPEVSLVAILDADKEGFLRSGRSLIQTIGRAARNLNGKAILYADHMTDSMKEAIGETERRRVRQTAHNLAEGITPVSIVKRIKEMIDGVYSDKTAKEELRAAKEAAATEVLSEKDLGKRIKMLEKQMLEHARNLEFEKAARLRDQLAALREQAFGAPGVDNLAAIAAAVAPGRP